MTMQEPFYNTYSNNQRFPPPSNFQWRPNFVPRGPPSRFRGPAPHWRQHAPQHQQYSNEFWCETCDRGFRSADILEGHKQQHQKCNIDGCQFIAHPKVITKHIQMQHASGLYKKIAKLQDPEEIKKWREERKNKYPTKENVAKAAAAIKEKIERGEKMGLKNNRHGNTHKREESGTGGKRKSFDKRNPHKPQLTQNSAPESKRRKFTPKYTVQKLPAAEETRKLKPFGGIQELMMDTEEQQDEPECDFTIEDEDEVVEASIPLETTSGSVCHALSSLICNYGSSDEDETDNPTIKTSSNTSSTKTLNVDTSNQEIASVGTETLKIVEKPIISQSKTENDDDSGPEEVKITKPVEINVAEDIETKPLVNNRKPKNKICQKPVNKRPKTKVPSTLLQKLLFKEMRHERNIVLQCIKHIIRNNFFEKSEL